MNHKLISLTLLILAFGVVADTSLSSRLMPDEAPKGWFHAGDHPQD